MICTMTRRALALPLCTAMALAAGPLPAAQAAMVPTERAIERQAAPDARGQLARFVARDDVRAELARLGVDPAEAAARVAALSDAELRLIADRLDEVPAGQTMLLGLVQTGVLVFLVLVVTDLLCLTSVFEFSSCGPIERDTR